MPKKAESEKKEAEVSEVKTAKTEAPVATSEAAEQPTEVQESAPKKDEKNAIVCIYSSQNNTMVHITDLAGNTISRITGGMVTKHSRLKSSPTIAMFVAKKAAERARDLGITGFYVRTRAQTGSIGPGPGSHAAVKTLGKEGFRILSVLDTTRVARGGPKKKGGRRGRRV